MSIAMVAPWGLRILEYVETEQIIQNKEDMSKSKEYKAIKNYIHNELGITKEDIIKDIKPLIEQIIKRYMHNTYGYDNDIEGWIRRMVENEIKKVDYDFVRRMYKDALRDTIADNLEIIVKPKENV